ncbi:CHC_CoA_lg domain containing protein [Paracoccaceae bacterium]
MRRTDFCRREQARRRRVAHAPKFSQDGVKAEGDVTGDVFEEDPFGGTFPDDTGDLGPQVARIVGTATLSGRAEGLAWISGENDVEGTAVGPGIEAAQIIPDWRWGEIACALGCDEDAAGISFPLDEGAGVKSGFGEHDAQIQASAACAEGQSVAGT